MNLKTNKGITLIALVITIIVLLILAGVTISMVLGDDGIITNATKAKEETEKMEYPERVRMAVASALVAGKGKGVNLDANTPVSEKSEDDNSVKNALEKEFGTEFGTVVTYTEGEKEGEIKVKKGALNQTFTVTAKGTVTKDNVVGDDDGDGSLSGDVGEVDLTITAQKDVVGVGKTRQLTASAEGVTWSSSDDTKATVDPTTGVVTGIESGEVEITATLGEKAATKTITVKNIINFNFAGMAYANAGYDAYEGQTFAEWFEDGEFCPSSSILNFDGYSINIYYEQTGWEEMYPYNNFYTAVYYEINGEQNWDGVYGDSEIVNNAVYMSAWT